MPFLGDWILTNVVAYKCWLVECFFSFQNRLERKHLEVEALNVFMGEHTYSTKH